MDYDHSEFQAQARHVASEIRKVRVRSPRSAAHGAIGGAIIVVVGLLLLLNNLGILHVRDIWDFWPLILVVFGVARIVKSCSPASIVWGSVVAGLGVLLFLDNLSMFRLNFNFVWPVILIGLGLTKLMSAQQRQRQLATGGVDMRSSSSSTLVAVFSGGKRRITTPDFRGVDVLALYGGFEVDLRGSRIEVDEAVIDVNVMFGGVKIIVPDNWIVNVKGFGMFGAFEDKTIPPRIDPNVKPQHLIVTGVSIFGGTSIRN
jgi:predicted membrane protein